MSKGTVLVTGGAGYIGAHTVRELARSGYEPVIYDDLSRGHREHVEGYELIVGKVEDRESLSRALGSRKFDAVIHFAAESQVGESMTFPEKYFCRNVIGGLTLFSAMLEAGIKKLVLSSSAAVYGEPEKVPIPEDSPLAPTNPYGETKAMLERILDWYDKAYGFKSIRLRYFNAAGADPEGGIGEEHEPETHLIPLVIRAAVTGEPVKVFGTDYPTNDGTAVRDYIHVTDLARAHVLALEALERGEGSFAVNLGTGRGYSVMEVIKTVEKVTGRQVPYEIAPRRRGDPAVLVASSSKAEEWLGFELKHSSLEEIVGTAWNWHKHRI